MQEEENETAYYIGKMVNSYRLITSSQCQFCNLIMGQHVWPANTEFLLVTL